MSAPEIPDLRTLLGNRRGGAARGRGRGRGAPGSSSQSNEAARDDAVRSTDQDAAGSRVSCVELGYLEDPYARCFATQASTRRLPLLNRGTYIRTSAIDILVEKFLETSPQTPKQIISLGAGTDTRFFRLKDYYPDINITYHEIDFPSNTASKLSSISRHFPLYNKLPSHQPPQPGVSTYHSSTYNIHALDLRDLASTTTTPPPDLPNLSPTTPTLLLSEMCLIYLSPSTVSSLLTTFLTTYIHPTTPTALILYEPIHPNDAFGRTMISNLSSRNIHLPTLTTYPTLADQRDRLKSHGFVDGCMAADVDFIWRRWIPEDEKERVGQLEMLDELEELELLLKHYCIAWGWRDGGGEEGKDVFARAWEDVPEQDEDEIKAGGDGGVDGG